MKTLPQKQILVVPLSNPFSVADTIRFISKITLDGPTPDQRVPQYFGLGPCWEWIAGRYVSGYGQVFMAKKSGKAHRAAYRMFKEAIPPGRWVLHKCDNKLCVNPEHLILGTHSDNVADRDSKGRNNPQRGEQHYTHRHPEWVKRGVEHSCRAHPEMIKRGEDHYMWGDPLGLRRGAANPQAKITESVVRAVREAWKAGGVTQRALALKFKISFQHVNSLVNHRSWAHID